MHNHFGFCRTSMKRPSNVTWNEICDSWICWNKLYPHDDPMLSGFLALLALAIYTGVTVTFFGKRFLDWRFSWSYIIGWVAIILAFAAGILCLFSWTATEIYDSQLLQLLFKNIDKKTADTFTIRDSVQPSFQVCFSCVPTSGPLPNQRLQITWTAEQVKCCCAI